MLIAVAGAPLFAAAADAGDATPQEAPAPKPLPKVIFFDVNETLLDLAPMRASVGEALGGRDELLGLWFSRMLHYSLVDNSIEAYHNFSDIGVAALMMVASDNGVELTEEDARTAIVTPLRSLPPHPDVRDGLERIRAQGFTMITLTNSSNQGVATQMKNADLEEFFSRKLSIEDIKTYKPHLSTYRWALEQVGVAPDEAMLVAAHGWDIAGAEAAGLQTAFIARPGKSLYPLSPAPDYEAADLGDLADQLAERASEAAE